MLSVTKPHPSQLHDILEKHQDLPFSYAEVGITKDGPNACRLYISFLKNSGLKLVFGTPFAHAL